jgi:hypothetical protein
MIEDKVKVNTLHSMEGLDRVYLMNTNKSPDNLIFNRKGRSRSIIRSDQLKETSVIDLKDSVDDLKYGDHHGGHSIAITERESSD